MQHRTLILGKVLRLALLLVFAIACHVEAADKPQAILLTKDTLTSPKHSAVIEARLSMAVPRTGVSLAGEPLELLQGSTVVASAVTEEGGRALFHFAHKLRGNVTLTVRTADRSSVSSRNTVTMASWEPRTPILMVEMTSLFDDPAAMQPLPDAADELAKLTQFYYHAIYVVTEESGKGDAFQAADRARRWLSSHKFPLGYVLVVPPSGDAFGKKLDELRDAGWTTIKIGVGRSKSFAEAFVQRRPEAVTVPEPSKSEKARKAKIAKEWKDVRKHF